MDVFEGTGGSVGVGCTLWSSTVALGLPNADFGIINASSMGLVGSDGIGVFGGGSSFDWRVGMSSSASERVDIDSRGSGGASGVFWCDSASVCVEIDRWKTMSGWFGDCGAEGVGLIHSGA